MLFGLTLALKKIWKKVNNDGKFENQTKWYSNCPNRHAGSWRTLISTANFSVRIFLAVLLSDIPSVSLLVNALFNLELQIITTDICEYRYIYEIQIINCLFIKLTSNNSLKKGFSICIPIIFRILCDVQK